MLQMLTCLIYRTHKLTALPTLARSLALECSQMGGNNVAVQQQVIYYSEQCCGVNTDISHQKSKVWLENERNHSIA